MQYRNTGATRLGICIGRPVNIRLEADPGETIELDPKFEFVFAVQGLPFERVTEPAEAPRGKPEPSVKPVLPKPKGAQPAPSQTKSKPDDTPNRR